MKRNSVIEQAGACICWEVVAGGALLLASNLVSRSRLWPDPGLQAALARALFWCGVACLIVGLLVDAYRLIQALRAWHVPRDQRAACPIRRAPGLLGRDIRDLLPRRRT